MFRVTGTQLGSKLFLRWWTPRGSKICFQTFQSLIASRIVSMCNSLLFATETCKRERNVVTASSTQAVKHLKLMTTSSIAQFKNIYLGGVITLIQFLFKRVQ